jgi:hypothetical protein
VKTEHAVNDAHVDQHAGTLEEEIAVFRRTLLARNPAMAPAELQRELGNYTARRKAELLRRMDS